MKEADTTRHEDIEEGTRRESHDDETRLKANRKTKDSVKIRSIQKSTSVLHCFNRRYTSGEVITGTKIGL